MTDPSVIGLGPQTSRPCLVPAAGAARERNLFGEHRSYWTDQPGWASPPGAVPGLAGAALPPPLRTDRETSAPYSIVGDPDDAHQECATVVDCAVPSISTSLQFGICSLLTWLATHSLAAVGLPGISHGSSAPRPKKSSDRPRYQPPRP